MIKIGKFEKTHGVKGYIKLISYTSNIMEIKTYKKFFINEKEPIEIKFVSKINKYLICKINDINSPEIVSDFQGKSVYISEDELPKLKKNQYYYYELENLFVKIRNKVVGKVFSVNNHGAGDYIEVKKLNGNFILVPYNDKHIKKICLKKKIIELSSDYYSDEI